MTEADLEATSASYCISEPPVGPLRSYLHLLEDQTYWFVQDHASVMTVPQFTGQRGSVTSLKETGWPGERWSQSFRSGKARSHHDLVHCWSSPGASQLGLWPGQPGFHPPPLPPQG